jgi:hypothetical protein
MPTTYEFVVETLDIYAGCGDDPDIIDTSGWETLDAAHRFAQSCDEPWRIVLRRDTGNDAEGITDRYYAYPDGTGTLPAVMETFMGGEDGPAVPQKFLKLKFPIDVRAKGYSHFAGFSPAKSESRNCFGIAWFTDEAEATRYAAAVVAAGLTYRGGMFDGMACGRDRAFDYDDVRGRLFAVTHS